MQAQSSRPVTLDMLIMNVRCLVFTFLRLDEHFRCACVSWALNETALQPAAFREHLIIDRSVAPGAKAFVRARSSRADSSEQTIAERLGGVLAGRLRSLSVTGTGWNALIERVSPTLASLNCPEHVFSLPSNQVAACALLPCAS